jgi:ferredoxin
MKAAVRIDDAACCGHGDCALVAPQVFEVDDVARVIGDAPLETLVEAAEACPAGAIEVVDADSGEQIYP